MNINKAASFFIISISVVIILVYGRSLLIPFVFATLLWFFIRVIKNQLDRIKFIKQKVPSWLKNLLISTLILSLLSSASMILLSSLNNLALSYEKYQSNLEVVIHKLNGIFHADLIELTKNQAVKMDFGQLFTTLFSSITDLLSNTFIILIYVLFIFFEEAKFSMKLKAIFPDEAKLLQFSALLSKIELSVRNYIGLKTLSSITTGIISYFILLVIGIDSPIFWAFLIFGFNFIPTIGSILATLFPTLFCLLQFGEFIPSLLVLIFVGGLQVIIGNILEPKLMGNTLNISPLVAILSLIFWGMIWGITGMIISVPVTVILVIIFAQFQNTRNVAIMLSEKGFFK
jgi:AI-2 transport protein TqsA